MFVAGKKGIKLADNENNDRPIWQGEFNERQRMA